MCSKKETVTKIGKGLSGFAGVCSLINIIFMMVMRFMHAGKVCAGSYNNKPGAILGAPYMYSSGTFMAVWSIICASIVGAAVVGVVCCFVFCSVGFEPCLKRI